MARRAISLTELRGKKYKEIDFEGVWLDHIGRPELSGVWLIYGDSSNGKTSYSLQLASYLTKFFKIGYNSLEERGKMTIRNAILRTEFENERRFGLIEGENYEEIDERLSKRKSFDIVFIDSIQYFRTNDGKRVTSLQFKDLATKHSDKLFILTSHVKGREPKGTTAQDIYYDADVKIFVQGFKATAKSRYGGKTPFIIWDEGALECWGTLDN